MNRHHFLFRNLLLALLLGLSGLGLHAQEEKPDALVKRLGEEVLGIVKTDKAIQAGDFNKASALLDSKIMPHFDFSRFTATAVGSAWRQATPEQRSKLQSEFKTLLIRTYLGGISQVKNETLHVKPLRAAATDTEVLVRTEVRGRADPIQLDYRLEKTEQGWKIYDMNVLGIWMGESYKGQFVPLVKSQGIDGLIASLVERNQAHSAAPAPHNKK